MPTAASAAESNGAGSFTTTKKTAQTATDDLNMEFDEADSDEEDAEIPEGSLFDYQISGVLTKDEVKRLDLEHWRLIVRDALIELEVQYHQPECVSMWLTAL